MKTFRVSTSEGDTYLLEAETLTEAKREAEGRYCDSNVRFTVYEENKPLRLGKNSRHFINRMNKHIG